MTKKNNTNSLYIHIPFCDHICSYCNFSKVIYNESIISIYLLDLLVDIKRLVNNKKKYKTIYIGGGTPSCIPSFMLETFLFYVSLLIDFNSNYEFSFEANVENLDKKKIQILKKYHVNRLSLGVQSFDDLVLKKMNRHHDKKQSLALIKFIKRNFTNFNIDLIYGSSFSSFQILKNDLEIIKEIDPPHVSIYSLILENNTMLKRSDYKELDDDQLRIQYDYIVSFLSKIKLERYEISNFAKLGYESKHNLTYWKNNEYDSLGASSSFYKDSIRGKYTCSIDSYIKEKKLIEKEILTEEEKEKYSIILNLRLIEGLSMNEYKERYNKVFLEEYKDIIEPLLANGLAHINGDKFYIDEDYIYVSDYLVDKFL